MESDSWLVLLSIAALISGSAFFSASEAAISASNRIRIRKKAGDGDEGAKRLLRIYNDYDRSLSAILVGNNIVNITASTLATLVSVELLGPARGAVFATVAMTLLILIFGEILPKIHSNENPDGVALTLSGPLSFMIRLFSPLSFLLTVLSRALKGAPAPRGPSITEEELIYMMDAIEEEGILEEQERELVQSALEFDETSLKEILTPRVNIVAVDIESDPGEVLRVVVEEGYSRIPVFEKTVDNIIGVLYAHDFLLGVISGREMKLRDMMGEALFVHKSMKLSHLLASFKAKKLNLAVVIDEYGGTLGIVTMEDVLEELVGDIWDEDEEIPGGFTALDENRFEAEGDHELSDMLERLGLDEDDVETDFSTVGGWALHKLGHITEAGESFEFDRFRFTVLEMDGHRLKRLGISRLPEEEEPDGQG